MKTITPSATKNSFRVLTSANSKTGQQTLETQLELFPQEANNHDSRSVQPVTAVLPNENVPARVLVVATLSLVHLGVARIVDGSPDFVVCGQANTNSRAIESVAKVKPNLVVIDISARGRIGLISDIVDQYGPVPMLAFSLNDNHEFAKCALRAGALGYITKSECPENFVDALRQVAIGKNYVSAELRESIANRIISGKSMSGIESVSNREFDVLREIGAGCGTRKIAQDLNLSIKTVESHRAHLKEKLNLSSGLELACFAARWVIQTERGPGTPSL